MPSQATAANALIESQLRTKLRKIEAISETDVLVYNGPIHFGTDDFIRDAVEEMRGRSHRKKLTVILETAGGYIEVAQRIADIFHRHYVHLQFLIPNFAMSAGTVLVMSGDAILMDYYSVLGPIDPQVEVNGKNVPAHGYLVQYDRLITKSQKGEITTAELQILLEKFDPGELYKFEQAMKLSVSLLKEWLVKYKFRSWLKTKSGGVAVTDELRKKRAEEVATTLSDSGKWHSHGRGIAIDVLRDVVKLEIEDFGKNVPLKNAVRAYTVLLTDFLAKTGASAVIHTATRYFPLSRDMQQP